jgi:hypothetical protein
MDKQPPEIQRGIEQQRRQIGEKLTSLRDRLQTDVQRTKSAWQRQSSRAGQQVRMGLAFSAGTLGVAVVLGVVYTMGRRAARKKRDNIIPLEVRVTNNGSK